MLVAPRPDHVLWCRRSGSDRRAEAFGEVDPERSISAAIGCGRHAAGHHGVEQPRAIHVESEALVTRRRATSCTAASGQTLPPPALAVFSIETMRVRVAGRCRLMASST